MFHNPETCLKYYSEVSMRVYFSAALANTITQLKSLAKIPFASPLTVDQGLDGRKCFRKNTSLFLLEVGGPLPHLAEHLSESRTSQAMSYRRCGSHPVEAGFGSAECSFKVWSHNLV